MASKIQVRRDTSDNWSSVNPILAQGEYGLNLDSGKVKCGDGITAWNDLDYCSPSQAEFASHMAENVSHALWVTRDLSIAGDQIIAIPFLPKNILMFANVGGDANKSSEGMWSPNLVQGQCKFNNGNSIANSQGSAAYNICLIVNSTGNYTQAIVKSVSATQLVLTWSKAGTGATGTVDLFIQLSTH